MPWLITYTDNCGNPPSPVCIVRDGERAALMVEEGNEAGRHNGPLHDGYVKFLFGKAEPAYPVPEPPLRRVPWCTFVPLADAFAVEEVPEAD